MNPQINPPRLVLWIALFLITAGSSSAQKLESKYQLKKARVALLNGQIYRGVLFNITTDSLIIEDKTLAPPGAIVYIRRRHVDQALKAKVMEVTETDLIVSRVEDNSLIKVARKDIDVLRIVESSFSEIDLRDYQKTRLHYSMVKYVALYKKGAPAIGAMAGLAISLAPFYSSIFQGREVLEEALIFGTIGVTTGLLIGSSKKKMMVDGDAGKFNQVRNKILGNP